MDKRHHRFVVAVAVGFGAATASVPASAATVGLWLFDDLVDTTPPFGDPLEDPPGGEILYDASPNILHFSAVQDFGTIELTSDHPGVMGPGAQALRSDHGGARLLSTPNSSLLDVGETGQLTVEFWYKHVGATSFPYVLSFNGGNGAGNYAGDYGFYVNAGASTLNFFAYPTSGFPEVSFGSIPLDGQWHHIAGTVTENGNLHAYLDGELVASTPVGAFPDGVSDVLKFGRDVTDGQVGAQFYIDELRISNVALLPGSGMGDGELAWNTSLVVPEPSTVTALVVIAVPSILARRRRAQ